MDGIKIIKESITIDDLRKIAQERFGDMVKTVVDVDQKIMALGSDLHADEEAKLLEQGSKQENLWGINIYPDQPRGSWVEFDSMINVRPRQNNRSRSVEDAAMQDRIIRIVNDLIQ
ncbi:MAG: DUF5674 family protein [Patescibacteria group bacterium]|nr:DUF5674 family protein [Patescibacteria group bacterium]